MVATFQANAKAEGVFVNRNRTKVALNTLAPAQKLYLYTLAPAQMDGKAQLNL